jgi:hypothetical protein
MTTCAISQALALTANRMPRMCTAASIQYSRRLYSRSLPIVRSITGTSSFMREA